MDKHTPGPWHWFVREDGHVYLATPDRGRLYVMDIGRRGKRSNTPRFSLWGEGPRERRGGIMHDFVDAGGPLHPDARLMAAAPDLLAALEAVVAVADRATDEFDKARSAIAKARGEA